MMRFLTSWLKPAGLLGVSVLLYWLSQYNYLVFHTTIEIFSAVVAGCVFLLTLTLADMSLPAFFIVVGCGQGAVAGLTLLHMATYKGMPLLGAGDANLPTQLWIATRLVDTGALFAGILMIGKTVGLWLVLGTFALISAGFLATLFIWPVVPNGFIAGIGMTPFKIAMEYMMMAVLTWSVWKLYSHRHFFSGSVRRRLIGAYILQILAAAAFTLYTDVQGLANMLGHLLFFLAYLLIADALVRHMVREPQAILFRDLTASEAKFRSLAESSLGLEAELVEERNLLKTVIDEIPDRIFVKDRQSRFILNNIAHMKALGAYSQSEVLGKTRHDFRPAAFADSHSSDDRIVMENDKPLYTEKPTMLPSGETGTLFISKTPLHNSAGEVIGLIGINRDITDRRRAEASERRSNIIQNILREIAETAVLAASLNEMYVKVQQLVNRVLPTKNFFIAMLDETAGEIVVPYCVDEANSILQRRPIGKGLAEYTMRQGQAVHLKAAALDQFWTTGDINLRFVQINEWLGAPLRNSAGEIFGVIALFSIDDEPLYEPDCTEVLSIIAAQVSMAIERKQAEATLESSEGKLLRAQAIAHVGDWEIELSSMKVWGSAEAFRIYGIEYVTPYLSLKTIQQFACKEDRVRLDKAMKALVERNEKYDVEYKIRQADHGLEKSIRSIAELEYDQKGNPEKIIGVIQDITERKQAEETLVESEARYRAVMEQAPEAVLLCDTDTNEILEANSRFTELFGYDLRRDGPLNMFDLIADSSAYSETILESLKQTGFSPAQRLILLHKNGTYIDVEKSATLVSYRGRNLFVMTLRDVSETVRREKAEYHRATHDELTGLYNRRGFAEGVTKLLATGAGGALLLVDIDDFKLINDVHGHGVGDKYLAAFAAYLHENFGEAALVARFGGDEFILFFAGADGVLGATHSSALMEVICLETDIGSFFVQLSGGISLLTEQEPDLDMQIQRAHLALHHAKESGKWCCKPYESTLQDKVSRRYAIKDALNNALVNEEYQLVFQPIFDIQESIGKIIGYEALLRWTHPQLGVIPPVEFISVAEETNLILPIGKWVLREACRFSVNIWEEYGEYVNVAVNISMRQLAMPNFVNMVKETLHETGLPACNLSLEVTESILMTDAATKISYLQELRDFGVAISLDDFGTGYSSFTYLAQMPISTLKIDKSMVDEIGGGGNSKSLLLLESLLQLSTLLGYRVVAEGVETQEQLIFLKSKGCGYCQGYLLGRPMSEAAVLEMYGERQKD